MFEPCAFCLECTVKSFFKWGTLWQQSKLAEATTLANFTRKISGYNRGHNTTLSGGKTQIFQANVEILHKIMLGNSQGKTPKHLATYHEPSISSTFWPIRLHLAASLPLWLPFFSLSSFIFRYFPFNLVSFGKILLYSFATLLSPCLIFCWLCFLHSFQQQHLSLSVSIWLVRVWLLFSFYIF